MLKILKRSMMWVTLVGSCRLMLTPLQWLKKVLPHDKGSGVKDISYAKYNYKPVELDRNINALWTRKDLGFTHERTRAQFHWLLLLFAHSGSRRGTFFTAGIQYRVSKLSNGYFRHEEMLISQDVHLVLKRTPDNKPQFFFKVDQRYIKNNKDPENKM